jgi:catechol 2,3-dioxygenase-like lactoylglutathione lyase family enzyme
MIASPRYGGNRYGGNRYSGRHTAGATRPIDPACRDPLTLAEAPMIKGIKFASIPVRDQDAALRFYTEKLGFVVVTDQQFDDKQRWIELRIPGAETRVTLFTPAGHEDRIGTFSGVSFVADDVQRTYDELSARGVEFTGPPKKADWGTAALFKDVDGNTFVLSSR